LALCAAGALAPEWALGQDSIETTEPDAMADPAPPLGPAPDEQAAPETPDQPPEEQAAPAGPSEQPVTPAEPTDQPVTPAEPTDQPVTPPSAERPTDQPAAPPSSAPPGQAPATLPGVPAGSGPWISENVAVLQGLDKVTARVSAFDAPLGRPVHFGTLEIIPHACFKRPPEEPPENAAFLEIREIKPGEPPVELFTGWMFSTSPALSSLEHPVYDIWVVDCKNDSSSASPSSR
jgi:hypothetical protein